MLIEESMVLGLRDCSSQGTKNQFPETNGGRDRGSESKLRWWEIHMWNILLNQVFGSKRWAGFSSDINKLLAFSIWTFLEEVSLVLRRQNYIHGNSAKGFLKWKKLILIHVNKNTTESRIKETKKGTYWFRWVENPGYKWPQTQLNQSHK